LGGTFASVDFREELRFNMKKVNNNSGNNKIDVSPNKERKSLDSSKFRIDKLDIRIIELLIAGKNNKYIAGKTNTPLSTVQRRTRKLFEKELLNSKVELNYEKLGYKRGFLHVYLSDGGLKEVGETIGSRPGILSVAVHIGNSDLVCLFIYKNSRQLLDIISETKLVQGVNRVLWSEEVYFIPMKEGKFNILNMQ
jgi:DNA-binding Lrp family transcriptional regulator